MSVVSVMMQVNAPFMSTLFASNICMVINYMKMFVPFQMWWHECHAEAPQDHASSQVLGSAQNRQHKNKTTGGDTSE